MLFDMVRDIERREEMRFRHSEEIRQNMTMQIENLQNEIVRVTEEAKSKNLTLLSDVRELGLRNGFSADTELQISGEPTRMGFRVTLKQNATENIALQLSADLARKTISRSSFMNGQWDPNEIYGGFPLETGRNFTMTINRDDSQFYVRVNGLDYCSFDHRTLDFGNITSILVEGNIKDCLILV